MNTKDCIKLKRATAFIMCMAMLLIFSGCSDKSVVTSLSNNMEEMTEDTYNTEQVPVNQEFIVYGNDDFDNNVDLQEFDLIVHFIDVGQGSSTLLESDGHYALIDGGDREYGDVVSDYLSDQGVTSLDYVIASHYDADHLYGVVDVLNTFAVDQVLCADYEADTKIYDSFWDTIEAKKIDYEYAKIRSNYVLGNASFEIVGPVSYDYDSNNNSIVVRVENGADSFLVTGDAESDSEEDMCAEGLLEPATVYLAGHHGSASSSTWELLEAVVPEYIVVSCGEDNSYGHPHEETLEKIDALEVPFFRTDMQGSIIAYSTGNGIKWNTTSTVDYGSGTGSDIVEVQTVHVSESSALATEYHVVTSHTYVLNTNTKKIHEPTCNYATQIKSENYMEWNGTSAKEFLAQNIEYSACQSCDPE